MGLNRLGHYDLLNSFGLLGALAVEILEARLLLKTKTPPTRGGA
jgi:hypothetical protein